MVRNDDKVVIENVNYAIYVHAKDICGKDCFECSL